MGNLGKYLRERRIEKGISIEYISIHSSINENILNALENGNYDYFHGSFYFTNYLNEYLKFLSLDIEKFHEEFSGEIAKIKAQKDEPIQMSLTGLRYSKFRNRRIVIKGILIVIILAIIFYLFFIKKGSILSSFENGKKQLPETGIIFDESSYYSQDYSPVLVELNFHDDCWLRVRRGNKIAIERVFISGELVEFHGYDLRLSLGNPSAVNIKINGKNTEKYKKLADGAFIRLNPGTLEDII